MKANECFNLIGHRKHSENLSRADRLAVKSYTRIVYSVDWSVFLLPFLPNALSQYIREAYVHKERKGHPQIA